MGKYSYAAMLDAALSKLEEDIVEGYLLSGEPEDYGDIGTFGIEIMYTMDPSVPGFFSSHFDAKWDEPPTDPTEEEDPDYEYSNTGRAMLVNKIAIASLDASGWPNCIVFTDYSDIIYKTPVSGSGWQEAGDPLIIDAWKITIHEPT